MKKVSNKLSRKQLNQLYKSFDCSTWKSKISELAFSTEKDEIIIPDDYIKLLLKDGTKDQITLVTSKDYGVIIPQEDKGIIDKIKTFEDALAIVGATVIEQLVLDFKPIDAVFDKNTLSHIASIKLSIIAKALNEGWIPDWSNSNEYKYYVWCRFGSSGGWVYGSYYDWSTGSFIGSRLSFKTKELAVYAGKQFELLYNDMFSM